MSEPHPEREALHELVRAALVGRATEAAVPASRTGLDDVLPADEPEATLLRRAGVLELARRAGRLPDPAPPLPEPDTAIDPRPLASPRIVAFVAYMLRPPGKLLELHREMFAALAKNGLRLPPRLAPALLTHPAVREHPDVPALIGARGAWLRQLIAPDALAKARRAKPMVAPDPALWVPGVEPDAARIAALAQLPRPFDPAVSAIVAGWLARFRDGWELQRHPLGAVVRAIALGLQPRDLPALLERAQSFYRPYKDALVIAETRRRFHEELALAADPVD